MRFILIFLALSSTNQNVGDIIEYQSQVRWHYPVPIRMQVYHHNSFLTEKYEIKMIFQLSTCRFNNLRYQDEIKIWLHMNSSNCVLPQQVIVLHFVLQEPLRSWSVSGFSLFFVRSLKSQICSCFVFISVYSFIHP